MSEFFPYNPEPKTVKNRVHLDLRAADVEEEVARLIGLGAIELADPEGNEFDVLPS